MPKRINPVTAFWAKVDVKGPDECWLWIGKRRPLGYGVVKRCGIDLCAHRYAVEITTNTKLEPRQVVMHACDNPPCCNPRHLKVGTQRENMADMTEKGRRRSAQGISNSSRKLIEADVYAIRASLQTSADLAKRYGVSLPAIISIWRRRTWSHLPARGDDVSAVHFRKLRRWQSVEATARAPMPSLLQAAE